MHSDLTFSGGIRAAVPALLVAVLGWSPPSVRGEGVLQPVKVLGQSGFHHAGSLSEIVPLSDGKRVVSSARDGSARLWDIESGRELQRYSRKESDDMWGLLVLPGEKELITAGSSGYVTRWDLETGKALKTYKHDSTAFRLALRPGNKEFVGTDGKNVAILWNLETGKKIRTFKGHTDSVYTALFIDGGKRLLTGASDGKLKLWEVETGKCEETFKKEFDDIFTILPSPDGKRFVMCCGDETVRVFETNPLKEVWKKDLENDAMVAAWSPDGTRVATACEDGHLYLLAAGDGATEKKIKVPGDDHTPIAFTTDGRELISGGDLMLYRFDVESGKRVLPGLGGPAVKEGVDAVALSKDGRVAYAVGDDDVVQAWETETGKALARYEVGDSARALMASPDGKFLAIGTTNGRVKLVNLENGKTAKEFQGQGSIDCLAYARKGACLIGAGSGEKVFVWHIASGKRLMTLEGHGNDINGMAVTPDGLNLLTVGDDKAVKLWDLETGKPLRDFDKAEDSLHGVACLADSRSFLVAPREPELLGWLAPPKKGEVNLTPEQLKALVEDLGDEQYEVRARATQTLIDKGSGILPLLETFRPSDPEAVFRLKKIHSDIRAAELGGEMEEQHAFEEDMYALAGSPDGRYWVAAVGSAANCRIVIGEARNEKLEILQEVSDGHSPSKLAFSADGTTFATGNRDGTVSVFRVSEGE